MAKAKGESRPTKRKPGRPATGRGILVGVRCQPEQLAKFDAWRDAEAVPPTRPQAILYLAELGLASIKTRGRKG
jgi:hypothetical protein